MSIRSLIAFATAVLVLSACNRAVPPPATQKVGGKVVHADGKPFTDGGTIEFRNETKPGLTSLSGIQPNGTFELFTMTAQHKVPGIEEGTYAVTITPNSPDQSVRPIVLKKKYVVGAGPSDLTVVIE